MKNETGEGKATVADYSNGADGSKEVEVSYTFDYEVFETLAEVQDKFSNADIINLANQRTKGTANSGARQKAIAPYAQDPNAPAAIRERMIKDAQKLGKSLADATTFVDSLLA
jgi:hypothetical protein